MNCHRKLVISGFSHMQVIPREKHYYLIFFPHAWPLLEHFLYCSLARQLKFYQKLCFLLHQEDLYTLLLPILFLNYMLKKQL